MRVVFVLQVILYTLYTCECHIIGGSQVFLTPSERSNEKCIPQSAICDKLSTWPCCDGNTCEPIAVGKKEVNISMCLPNNNNCKTDSDCVGGLGCIIRLGKCGLCNAIGKSCSLPYDNLECCSSYCALHNFITDRFVQNSGVCANPGLTTLSITLPHSATQERPTEGGSRTFGRKAPYVGGRATVVDGKAVEQPTGGGSLNGFAVEQLKDVHISNLNNIISNNGESIIVQPCNNRDQCPNNAPCVNFKCVPGYNFYS